MLSHGNKSGLNCFGETDSALKIMPQAILLDLDDTLIDNSGSAQQSWRLACESWAAEVVGPDVAPLVAEINRVREWYWSDQERHRLGRQDLRATSAWIVHQALLSLGHNQMEVAHAIAHAYCDRRDATVEIFPATHRVLEKLRARDLPLALVTNGTGPAQRAKIERFDLARYFDAIFVEGEVGIGKPDERVYRLALETLGAKPEETWMVGDNFEWEVVAPARLGLGTVWVNRHGTEVPSAAGGRPMQSIASGAPPATPVRPTHVIASIEQLLDLLP
jgi:putative hydrolase of the HAD superfamily